MLSPLVFYHIPVLNYGDGWAERAVEGNIPDAIFPQALGNDLVQPMDDRATAAQVIALIKKLVG